MTDLDALLTFREHEGCKALSKEKAIEFFLGISELLYFDCHHEKVDRIEMEKLLNRCKDLYSSFSCCGNTDFKEFEERIPELKRLLDLDAKAIYGGDPAARSITEVVLTYPGFLAIRAYRIAHELYGEGYCFPARVISEYAHSLTGIDIHPGAKIGESFFIDHGTGIVIGETTEIGDNVKLYQGVTLGALSLKEGRALSGKKRHPTVEDDVTIYSGASIFGGETVIGKGSTIGSSAFITSSIPPYSRVKIQPYDLEIAGK